MENESLPFSQACENNKKPILEVLKRVLNNAKTVLEVGSGTGQHAAFFAEHLPHLVWQPSDRKDYLDLSRQWVEYAQLKNLLEPIQLDVNNPWPTQAFDALFSANTVHIMSWTEVEKFIPAAAGALISKGTFCLYGPFNYQGRFTSESNAKFDQFLKQRDPLSGIRDIEALIELADKNGLVLSEDNAMPANNRLLIWHKV